MSFPASSGWGVGEGTLYIYFSKMTREGFRTPKIILNKNILGLSSVTNVLSQFFLNKNIGKVNKAKKLNFKILKF